jgi:uncharacterized protein YfbU (UPF0304 family)
MTKINECLLAILLREIDVKYGELSQREKELITDVIEIYIKRMTDY